MIVILYFHVFGNNIIKKGKEGRKRIETSKFVNYCIFNEVINVYIIIIFFLTELSQNSVSLSQQEDKTAKGEEKVQGQ